MPYKVIKRSADWANSGEVHLAVDVLYRLYRREGATYSAEGVFLFTESGVFWLGVGQDDIPLERNVSNTAYYFTETYELHMWAIECHDIWLTKRMEKAFKL